MSFLAFSSTCKIPHSQWTHVCKVSNHSISTGRFSLSQEKCSTEQRLKKLQNKSQLFSYVKLRKSEYQRAKSHCHNWNYTITFEVLVSRSVIHAHKHGNTSKFVQLDKSYFDIFLPFYSPKHTTEIKIELNLSSMIQFKFNI